MPTKPEILKASFTAQTRLFQIEELQLRFSNGVERTYERLCTRGFGAVMIIPVLNDNTILMINEYAAGINEYLLTLPKGLIDKGETVVEAANRELMEEVGYGAKKLTPFKVLTSSPNYMSHSINVVIAEDLYPKRLPGDEPEELEVLEQSIDTLPQLLMEPNATEARVIAALMLWLHERQSF